MRFGNSEKIGHSDLRNTISGECLRVSLLIVSMASECISDHARDQLVIFIDMMRERRCIITSLLISISVYIEPKSTNIIFQAFIPNENRRVYLVYSVYLTNI